MRLYLLLITIAIAMAFSAGYLSLSIREIPPSAQETLVHLTQAKEGFVQARPAIRELNLQKLFPSGASSQLLDPQSSLPQSQKYPYDAISALFRYSKACVGRGSALSRDSRPAIRKAGIWAKFACGWLQRLPHGFFESEPLIHPSGASYAFLATGYAERLKIDRDWIWAHIHLFHVSELKQLKRFSVELDPEREVLAQLDPDSLAAIAENDELVLSDKLVLYRKSAFSEASSSGVYSVYPRRDWDEFISKSPFTVSRYQEGQYCFYRDGHACWKYNVDRLYTVASKTTIVFFVASLLLTLSIAALLLRRIRMQKAEEEQKRFALQTLTHELRTPLSSLVVSLETLRKRFDSVPVEAQDALIRIFDDVQRLQRLTEASKQYLTSHDQARLIAFRYRKVESMKSYVESVLEPFRSRVSLELPEEDFGFALDGYWVAICVKNLVENAILHGKTPVRVALRRRASGVEFVVEDGGTCAFPDLDRMADPFVKGKDSRGIGLGLSIVRKVVEEMKGELRFTPSPTRFALWITEGA